MTFVRPKRTWREVVENDCQVCKLSTEDAVDRSRWRKLIKDVWWTGWVWVGECFFWYQPTRVVLDKGLLNVCVRACVGPVISKSTDFRPIFRVGRTMSAGDWSTVNFFDLPTDVATATNFHQFCPLNWRVLWVGKCRLHLVLCALRCQLWELGGGAELWYDATWVFPPRGPRQARTDFRRVLQVLWLRRTIHIRHCFRCFLHVQGICLR